MTDACLHPTKALNTHTSNLHKTAGYRPVQGADLKNAFQNESHDSLLAHAHKSEPLPKPDLPPKPVPADHLSAKEHNEAVEAAHATSSATPHVGSALKAAEPKGGSKTKDGHTLLVAPPEMEVTHPSHLHGHIKSVSVSASELPDTHKELKDSMLENLHDASVGLNRMNAAKHEDEKAAAKVAHTKQKVDKAEKDATEAHAKLAATKAATKSGNASMSALASAHKDAAAKTNKAQAAAKDHIEAKKTKEKASTDLEAEKLKTSAAAAAAVTAAHVAASTTKGPAKSTADKVADHAQKTLKPLLPKPAVLAHQETKVKTGCDFLDNAVLLTDLKPIHSIGSKDPSCVGFGSYIEKGEQKLGAVHCKLDPHTNACPAQFDARLCHVVPMDVSKLEPLFKHIFA